MCILYRCLITYVYRHMFNIYRCSTGKHTAGKPPANPGATPGPPANNDTPNNCSGAPHLPVLC